MPNLTHILNGDGLFESFSKAGIPGEIIIWREGFGSGRARYDFDNKTFLNERADHWKQFEELRDENPSYEKLFISELEKLRNLKKMVTPVLWFEHDLFCQVNMIAILSWIFQQKRFKAVELVCTDHHHNHPHFRGLGQLFPEELVELFVTRTTLEYDDLDFADEAWRRYTKSDPGPLEQFILNSNFPGAFAYLKNALFFHLQRFPSKKNGTNTLETSVLNHLKEGSDGRKELVRNLILQDDKYGFGDLEFYAILDILSPFYSESDDGTLQLNQVGIKLLNGELDLFDFRKTPYFLGGVSIASPNCWRWGGNNLKDLQDGP